MNMHGILKSMRTKFILSVVILLGLPLAGQQPVLAKGNVNKPIFNGGVVTVAPSARVLTAQKYAPIVKLHSQEEWFPSSVSFFHTKTYLENGHYWQHANMDGPSDWNWDGALGQNPDTDNIPIYAFILDKFEGSTPYMDVAYFMFYPYNRGKRVVGTFWGNHVGDWEHVTIRFSRTSGNVYVPVKVTMDAHGNARTYNWSDSNIQKQGDQVVVYSAQGSHGLYNRTGNFTYKYAGVEPLTDYTNSSGKTWNTKNNVVTIEKEWRSDENTTPITGLHIGDSPSCPGGYYRAPNRIGDLLNGDLNEGNGGDYVYLCLARDDNTHPITDLKIDVEPTDAETACNSGYNNISGYNTVNIRGDHNSSMSHMDICKSTTVNNLPIIDLYISGGECAVQYETVQYDVGGHGNINDGGEDIYLCVKRTQFSQYECTASDKKTRNAESCNDWLNYKVRWGRPKRGTCMFGECQLNAGPTAPIMKGVIANPNVFE